MPKRVFRIPIEATPLLDIVSYGGGGQRENGIRLTLEQIEHIRRTVQRVPEVMVKVLPRASNDLKAVGKHFDYISRYGNLALETDDGVRLEGQAGTALLDEWDLDIDDLRRQSALSGTQRRKAPKLVHKLMLSMPAGTPPDKVRAAVGNFAREEFWGQHRYAFVLHTDEDHPHVHLVLKAVNEHGVRLNIKKETLRHWRSEFASHLRQVGVQANATERAVRGQTKKAQRDGIYRASLRGESTHMRSRAEAAANHLVRNHPLQAGARVVRNTREQIVAGWNSVARMLAEYGARDLATSIREFVDRMPPAQSEQEIAAVELLQQLHRTRILDRANLSK